MANRPSDDASVDTGMRVEDVLRMHVPEVLNLFLAPRRGSEEYREQLGTLLHEHDGSQFVASMRNLYDMYGWKGLADLQQMMLDQMHTLAANSLRDALGRVVLKRLVAADMDEEQVLRMAVDLTRTPGAEEIGFNDFGRAYDYGQKMVESLRPFADTFQQCLDHLAQGHGDRVWPTLARMPQMRDTDTHYEEVSQATLTLLVAVHVIHSPRNIKERMAGVGLPPLSPQQAATLRRFGL